MARKVGMTLDQVVAAAADVADREGLAAVTLARVATELGIRSPSLYSHVDGLAGLRRAMAFEGAARLGAEIDRAVAGRSGVDALTALAHAYRRFASAHPGLYATMVPTPSPEEDDELYRAFATPVAAIAGILAGLGIPEPDRVPVVRALRSALHGFVSLESAGGFGLPVDVDESFATLVALLVAGISTMA